MRRLRTVLVLGGVVSVTTWVVAPAAPPPAPPPMTAADLAAFDQATPAVNDVNAQVARLRQRLSEPPTFPVPTRNPFRFGPRPGPPPPTSAAPPIENAPPVLAPPAPVLPRLVAILANTAEGTVTRRAVLASGDDVHVLSAGDPVGGGLFVHTVDAEIVELIDPISGATYRLTLR